MSYPYAHFGMQQGWVCPRCSVVNAPMTPFCYRCAPPLAAPIQRDTTAVNPKEYAPTAGGAKDMDRW